MPWLKGIMLCLAIILGPIIESLYNAPTQKPKVLAFAGSTRVGSYNKKLAKEAACLAEELGGDVTFIDLKQYPIPLYDGDDESSHGMPANAVALRKLMLESNIMLIASPDYNRSFPAVLKNVLDWTSRTEEGERCRKVYKGKKIVIMSSSSGGSGGIKALPQLRSLLEALGGDVLPGHIGVSKGSLAFDEDGHLKDQALRQALKAHIQQAFD